MKKYKFLSVSVLLILSIISVLFLYFINIKNVDAHWADTEMNVLIENNILNGYDDGNLYPDRKVTRAEYAKMFVELTGLDNFVTDNVGGFTDVSANHWAYNYINITKDIIPNDGVNFSPDEELKRIDMVYTLSYFLDDINSTNNFNREPSFTDTEALSNVQKICLNYAVDNEYINGYPDNEFKPNNGLTRAEAATFLYKVFFRKSNDMTSHIKYLDQKTASMNIALSNELTGTSLKVYNNVKDEHNGLILTENIDYPLNILFSNFTGADGEFMLKVFYDYKEIDFKVANEFVSEYVFDLNSPSTIVMPLFLSDEIQLDDYSHKLTVVVFAGTNQYACDYESVTDSYGQCLDYEIRKPQTPSNNYMAHDYLIESNPISDINFSGFVINDDIDDAASVKMPSTEIRANPGETIDLNLFMGNIDGFSEYAAIVFMDWDVVDINGSSPLLLKTQGLSQQNFTLKAPEMPGKYEICGILIPNPFNNIPESSFYYTEYAYRFTLLVE